MHNICWTPLELHNIFLNIQRSLKEQNITRYKFLKDATIDFKIEFFQNVINALPKDRQRVVTHSWVFKLSKGYVAWCKSKTVKYWWQHCSTSCFFVPKADLTKSLKEWDKIVQGKLTIEQLTTPYKLTSPRHKPSTLIMDKDTTTGIDSLFKNNNISKKNEQLVRALIRDELNLLLTKAIGNTFVNI